MTTEKIVLIVAAAVIVVFIVQWLLSGRKNGAAGLFLPLLCFVAATVLVAKQYIDSAGQENFKRILFAVLRFFAYNVPTFVMLAIYSGGRGSRKKKERRLLHQQQADEAHRRSLELREEREQREQEEEQRRRREREAEKEKEREARKENAAEKLDSVREGLEKLNPFK